MILQSSSSSSSSVYWTTSSTAHNAFASSHVTESHTHSRVLPNKAEAKPNYDEDETKLAEAVSNLSRSICYEICRKTSAITIVY